MSFESKNPNSILLAAAMGGILSFATACGESDKYKNATPPPTPPPRARKKKRRMVKNPKAKS